MIIGLIQHFEADFMESGSEIIPKIFIHAGSTLISTTRKLVLHNNEP